MRVLSGDILSIVVFPDHLFSPFEIRANTSLDNTIYDLFIYHIKLLLVGDASSDFIIGYSLDSGRDNMLVI